MGYSFKILTSNKKKPKLTFSEKKNCPHIPQHCKHWKQLNEENMREAENVTNISFTIKVLSLLKWSDDTLTMFHYFQLLLFNILNNKLV